MPYHKLVVSHLEYIHKNVIPIQAATADAVYDFSLAHQVLNEHEISVFVRPQAIHNTHLATRRRGSGGPRPLRRDRIERKAYDLVSGIIPRTPLFYAIMADAFQNVQS